MKQNKVIFSAILLVIFSLYGNGQGINSKDFFFIQITDPQIGMSDSNAGFEKETELYEKAVVHINRLEPDFVIITGDLVNKQDDKSQIAEFKRITSKIKTSIPVYVSPGNHDIGQTPTEQTINEFIRNYGYDRFSFKHKKSLFIGLNSCIIKSSTPLLEESQNDWLQKELRKKARHKLIFVHYPFFITSPDEPDQYFNIPLETRKKYLDLFKENNVDVIFAGHLHDNGYGKDGNMEMVTTSAVGKPLAKYPSGMRIIKVYSDRIENEYYSLEEVPSVISLEQ
jgi:serine/threonine-protein phosphatase CPPED1